jgi:hypothetical protein
MSIHQLPPFITFKMGSLGLCNANSTVRLDVQDLRFSRSPVGTLAEAEQILDVFLADIKKSILETYQYQNGPYETNALGEIFLGSFAERKLKAMAAATSPPLKA